LKLSQDLAGILEVVLTKILMKPTESRNSEITEPCDLGDLKVKGMRKVEEIKKGYAAGCFPRGI